MPKNPSHQIQEAVAQTVSMMRTTFADGRTEESAGGAGEAHWRNPVTHALENIGTTEAHALAIDVKKPCRL